MDEIARVMDRYCSEWELVREESERPAWLPAAVTEHESVPVYVARGELKAAYDAGEEPRREETGLRRHDVSDRGQVTAPAAPDPAPVYDPDTSPDIIGAAAVNREYTPPLQQG
ncbi:MAG: hypothetical protein ABEI97_02560 [Candidatus Nanohaloarchaea archaeon]